MRVLFLDESGDNNLKAIDPDYPIFVLGGVIVGREYAFCQLTDALNEFKQHFFGRTDLVLHTADITRNRNGFEDLRIPDVRSKFYDRLNSLMQELQYEVVACVILKNDYLERYGVDAIDPYRLGLRVMTELLLDVVGLQPEGGTIVAERRGEALDQDVRETWEMLKERGSLYAEAEAIRNSIQALDLRGKQENIAGLQLADLVVGTIGRHFLGKQDKEDWRIVERKLFRGSPGDRRDAGVAIFPKQ